jgi:hypothetical protein
VSHDCELRTCPLIEQFHLSIYPPRRSVAVAFATATRQTLGGRGADAAGGSVRRNGAPKRAEEGAFTQACTAEWAMEPAFA